MNLQGKNILVLGLGDTGLSALHWLKRQSAVTRVADSRENPPHAATLGQELPGVELVAGPFREELLHRVEMIVISPGVPMAEPLVQAALARGIPVLGDVELFAQARGAAKVLAITGSNGKSTVTSMVGAMCRAAGLRAVIAGNIGLPVLDALSVVEERAELGEPAPDVYVLELSSFQLETTSNLNATAAVVLNVTEDHMDRYAGIAEYAAAKARIFQGGGVQVLNRQDALSMAMAQPGRVVMSFGLDVPDTGEKWGVRESGGEAWLAQGRDNLMPVRELPLAGSHNAANALAALVLCRAIDLPYPPLLQALRAFKGLPHRVEWVAKVAGVEFYDDSKGTNVGATEAALKGMPQPVVLIAGGDGKGQDFTPLKDAVAKHARAVVLIGRDGDKIAAALAGSGVPELRAATMEQAVSIAFAQAQPGDAVLLSPACASFDMFRNYEHRAQVFVNAVHDLAASHTGSAAHAV